MSARGGTLPRPSTTVERAVRQPARGLALPVELQRRRADDDRRERAVGLERGERLDRLAEALLVGEERAPRVQRRSARRPTGTARARRRAPRRPRRSARPRWRASCGSRISASSCSARSSASARRGEPVDLDLVQGDEVVELLDDPRVERHRALGLRRRQALERGARVRVPQHLDLQPATADAGPRRPAARAAASSPELRERHAALGGGVDARRGQLAQRLARAPPSSGRACGRRARRRRPRAPRGSSPRACAAPTSRGRRGASTPTLPDPAPLHARAATRPTSGARDEVREAVEHVGDVHRAPVVHGRPPLAARPSRSAAAGSRARRRRCAGRTGTRARRSPRARAERRSSTFGRSGTGSTRRTVEGGARRRLAGQPGRFATVRP